MGFCCWIFIHHGSCNEGHEEGWCRWSQCHSRVEEEWPIQAWWTFEHEAQEEAGKACPQGSEPFHKGALRLQGQASKQDCSCSANKEAQGDDQLNCLTRKVPFYFLCLSFS